MAAPVHDPRAMRHDPQAKAAYAKAWRRDQVASAAHLPMYHDEAAILAHYEANGSIMRAVEELGVAFYVVRATLQRNGIKTNPRGKRSQR